MKTFNGNINGVNYSDPIAFARAISVLDPSKPNEISAETLEQDTDVCWYPGQDNSTSPNIEFSTEKLAELTENIADHYEFYNFCGDDIINGSLQAISNPEKEAYKTNLKRFLEVLNTKAADHNENIELLNKKQTRLQEELDELDNMLNEESNRLDNLKESIDDINYVLKNIETQESITKES